MLHCNNILVILYNCNIMQRHKHSLSSGSTFMENVHPRDSHIALQVSVAHWVQCFLSDKVWHSAKGAKFFYFILTSVACAVGPKVCSFYEIKEKETKEERLLKTFGGVNLNFQQVVCKNRSIQRVKSSKEKKKNNLKKRPHRDSNSGSWIQSPMS